ncbi:hypothetical protein [Rhodococcus sp. NPDC049939]|uniref:hypothetical protein n=1 Tax=Rhodococcus sp. NPDC049939 TaxID=3155511 RepID=UPI0034103F46
MIEVEATHITNEIDPEDRRLVCELYPGILVFDGISGPFTVREAGKLVDPLPNPGGERTFLITDRVAELAAEEYDRQMGMAEISREWPHSLSATVSQTVWPPREWAAYNERFFDNADKK